MTRTLKFNEWKKRFPKMTKKVQKTLGLSESLSEKGTEYFCNEIVAPLSLTEQYELESDPEKLQAFLQAYLPDKSRAQVAQPNKLPKYVLPPVHIEGNQVITILIAVVCLIALMERPLIASALFFGALAYMTWAFFSKKQTFALTHWATVTVGMLLSIALVFGPTLLGDVQLPGWDTFANANAAAMVPSNNAEIELEVPDIEAETAFEVADAGMIEINSWTQKVNAAVEVLGTVPTMLTDTDMNVAAWSKVLSGTEDKKGLYNLKSYHSLWVHTGFFALGENGSTKYHPKGFLDRIPGSANPEDTEQLAALAEMQEQALTILVDMVKDLAVQNWQGANQQMSAFNTAVEAYNNALDAFAVGGNNAARLTGFSLNYVDTLEERAEDADVITVYVTPTQAPSRAIVLQPTISSEDLQATAIALAPTPEPTATPVPVANVDNNIVVKPVRAVEVTADSNNVAYEMAGKRVKSLTYLQHCPNGLPQYWPVLRFEASNGDIWQVDLGAVSAYFVQPTNGVCDIKITTAPMEGAYMYQSPAGIVYISSMKEPAVFEAEEAAKPTPQPDDSMWMDGVLSYMDQFGLWTLEYDPSWTNPATGNTLQCNGEGIELLNSRGSTNKVLTVKGLNLQVPVEMEVPSGAGLQQGAGIDPCRAVYVRIQRSTNITEWVTHSAYNRFVFSPDGSGAYSAPDFNFNGFVVRGRTPQNWGALYIIIELPR